MHKAWCSIEEVPYYFSGSSIKFQGHTGWKVNDLNPICVGLLGRSQLSNPSDLPCFYTKEWILTEHILTTMYPILINWFFTILHSNQCWYDDRCIYIAGLQNTHMRHSTCIAHPWRRDRERTLSSKSDIYPSFLIFMQCVISFSGKESRKHLGQTNR